MAHKVHPFIFRIGTTTNWPSRWFARKQALRTNLEQDIHMRESLKKTLKDASVNRIEIERSRGTITIIIHSARPGIIIGRSGAGVDDLKKRVLKEFFPGKAKTVNLNISVQEVARPGLESNLVMQGMIQDLERRMAFRRVLKSNIERAKKAGALGIKLTVSGRLNGAEIARTEKLSWGKIPLTNLRADIDYAQSFAQTMAGSIGVKVWIYRGDVFEQDRMSQYLPQTPSRRDGRNDGGRGQDRRDPRRDGRSFRDRAPGEHAPASQAPAAPAAEPAA